MPDFSFEDECSGLACGLDEVGRGPIAGPVVGACVFIPLAKRDLKIWRQVNDSKLLKPSLREELAHEIKAHAVWGIAECCPREIETMNILQASLEAMRRAYNFIAGNAMFALVDGNKAPCLPCSVRTIVKGDQKSVSIAAASIIAKVHRDALMARLAETHPHYGWAHNVGYPTPEHIEGIERHGITDHHRKTFGAVRNFIETGSVRVQYRMAV
ncbi:MAG: ribonuclease HII [Alphaproteobacteria bacterium]|nr:ribonuclease HII [Alphaproteobacteria bacterium]